MADSNAHEGEQTNPEEKNQAILEHVVSKNFDAALLYMNAALEAGTVDTEVLKTFLAKYALSLDQNTIPGAKSFLQGEIDLSFLPLSIQTALLAHASHEKIPSVYTNRVLQLLGKLPPQQKAEIYRWFTPFMYDIHPATIDASVGNLFLWHAVDSDSPQQLFGAMLEGICDHRDRYTYSRIIDDTSYDIIDTSVDQLADMLYAHIDYCLLYVAAIENFEKQKILLGILVDKLGFPHVINSVRTLVDAQKEHELQKKQLERIGRLLLGVEPNDESVPFHTTLNSVYRSLEFDKYQTNIEANKFEIPFLINLLKDNTGRVVYLGAGTGRIPNALAAEGIENITALDISPENLRKAKETDSTGKVLYMEADMRKPSKIEAKSVKRVISFGRTLAHAKDRSELSAMVKEAARIMDDDAEFYFDLPLNTEGEYFENRKRYVELLVNLGIPLGRSVDEALNAFEYVIDSASRKDDPQQHLYNRFVPGMRTIKQVFLEHGLYVEELHRNDIVDENQNKKGVNVYYRAVKKVPQVLAKAV